MKRGIHAAAWAGLALAAFLLWPQRWGGTMTYDVTHGVSMQPTFRTGDLAVLRKASNYQVGDIAAYRSPSLHTTVMHRIKTKTPAGYTFKGDNNSFTDPDTVTDREMLGKLVLRIGGAGKVLGWLLKPINLLLLAGAVFFLLSDRKDKVGGSPPAQAPRADRPAVPAAPLVVRVKALRLPQELPTAELETQSDLHALAALHGIAVLRTENHDVLLQGGMLFTWDRAEPVRQSRPASRHLNPQGRDWDYSSRAAADVIQLDSRRAAVS